MKQQQEKWDEGKYLFVDYDFFSHCVKYYGFLRMMVVM